MEGFLNIYNSLTKKKQVFQSIFPQKLGMYVCGPTVYSKVHLGNIRTFINFDLVFRYFKHLNYEVRYVRNITDVGHMEEDIQGEDKIIKRARIEKVEPMEVVQRYTLDFHRILNLLNTLPPSIEPSATGHVIEQIEIVKSLLEKGFAYEVDGSVYFDVLKYHKKEIYGILSGRKIEDALHNTRSLEGQSQKKNPQDFALWKKANKEHIMSWTSPWGIGFPGWHLECTAMSTKYLGKNFDIHGGGIDLKFPHHECEIAQSKGFSNQNPVNFWMHTNMLTINGKKMSKSLKNDILPEDIFTGNNTIFSKPFSPMVLRLFMMQAHYRSVLDFSKESLESSEKSYKKLMDAIANLNKINPSKNSTFNVIEWKNSCYKAINDDFNTPVLFSFLFEAIKNINLLKEEKISLTEDDLIFFKKTLHIFVFEILGLFVEDDYTKSNHLNRVFVELLINIRNRARDNRDWKTADHIRDELKSLRIQLKDEKEGTIFAMD